jgi:hypothetical protein
LFFSRFFADLPYPCKPQTPEEKEAVAARKVARAVRTAVKKRLQRQAVAARKVQREEDREVKREVKKALDGMVAQLVEEGREKDREVKKAREVQREQAVAARKVQREEDREVKKALDGMVAQLVEEGRAVKKRLVEEVAKKRLKKRLVEERFFAEQAAEEHLEREVKRRRAYMRSGGWSWHKNCYGQWEQWTER